MYHKQKGINPTITYLVGFILVALIFFGYLVNVYWIITTSSSLGEVLLLIIMFAIMLSPIFILGIGICGLFPEIHVAKDGIEYRYLEFFTGKIFWHEVRDIVTLKSKSLFQGNIVIIISRKGYNIFNRKGLFFQAFYGRLIQVGQPVIILSPGLENRTEILRNISEKSKQNNF